NSLSLTLSPGAFKLYTDVKIKTQPVITALGEVPMTELLLYPNPVRSQLHIEVEGNKIENIQAMTITGAAVNLNRVDETIWDTSAFPPGLYILQINTDIGIVRKK